MLNSAGFDSLREFILDNWNIHELVDDAGNSITKLNPSNDRTEWTQSTGNTLEISTTINGGDADITAPVTIVESRIYQSGRQDPIMNKTLAEPITLDSDGDSRRIRHQIKL